MAQFLLIHGSCHGAWCWDDLTPYLTQAGHSVRAIDLPSHGHDTTAVGDVTLDSYARAITAAMDGPTILVGHSMAGYPITAAAALAPERIAALVYVCAYVPLPGMSLAQRRRTAPRQPLMPAVRVAHDRVTFSFDPEMALDVLFHDVAPDRAAWAISQLGPQPIAPQEIPFDYDIPDLPRHYVRCTDDRAIPPEFQVTMTDDWPAQNVTTMDTSHSPFLSDPATLASHLIAVAKGTT